ncbi:MAG: transcriptional repressor LexA [Clostridiales bacterium]|jgi:repressor LexA|nr:transcriptional repressor LexA [Clostridiales bacterium]
MTSQYPKKRSHPRGDTQNRILEYIKKQVADKGYPPSVREIGEAVGLKSTSTVHGHLKRLESKGLIKRDAMKPRAMELLIDNDASTNHMVQMVPLLGPVAAGQPILAEESIRETLPIPSALLGNGTYFALAIRGDSMIQAGILNGDYVIVRQQTDANNGDIVVAMVGGDATVKRYYRENGRFRLQPENPAMQPIYTTVVEILGKVVSVFRLL